MTKFYGAIAAYAALAAAGFFLISDQRVRICLWIFLGGLGAKTWIARERSKPEEPKE